MLCRAAFHLAGDRRTTTRAAVERVEAWLSDTYGRTPAERAEAVRRRYGKDRTFSVPILMTCALAGLVPWHEVPPLPFELACLPQSWYRFARLPVVSYALPALIAIGQASTTTAAVEPAHAAGAPAGDGDEPARAGAHPADQAAASWRRRR